MTAVHDEARFMLEHDTCPKSMIHDLPQVPVNSLSRKHAGASKGYGQVRSGFTPVTSGPSMGTNQSAAKLARTIRPHMATRYSPAAITYTGKGAFLRFTLT